jgi:hypothetical protein
VSATTDESVSDAASLPGPLPAPFRWVLDLPGSPLWSGVVASLLALTLGIALTAKQGGLASFATHVVYALYWLWTPLALAAFVRGTARDAAALAPAWCACEEDAEVLRERVFRGAARAAPWGLLIGLGVALLDLVMILKAVETTPYQRGFVVVRELVVCLVMFPVILWAVGAAQQLSRITREHARVDLLDPGKLAPLGRCGTRLAVWWLVMIGLGLVLLFDPNTSGPVLGGVLLSMLAFSSMAALALAIPTWGAHQALAAAKQAELDRVRTQLREAREGREDARLPGLLAWEQRIRSVSEWPIDARSARLTSLSVLIPFAGWVAGAFVERAVSAVFG